jgi:carboxyl-terminal processing protease
MNKISRHLKIILVGIIAGAIWILGPGFYRNLSANSEETYEGLKIFSEVIEIIEKNYVDPVESKKMIEDAIQGMVNSLDPHSVLLTPDAFKELQIDTQGEFTGIGIHVTMRNNLVTVISPIEGTPAYRAGIKAGDKIVKVDGKPTEDLRDAVKRMRGPKGTEVVITVLREDSSNPVEFKIIRDVIPIHSVKAIMLNPGYGYIWITNFRDNTTEDMLDALDKLEEVSKNPLKGLILDLRDNPGGILSQAIQVADLFLEEGEILSIKGRLKKHTKVFYAHKNDTSRDYPIVILVNGGSASASEIVAGALQDHQRALILGTTSFGKGSVQTVESLRDGYGLKFTIARYYTPSGRSIQAKGVEPDIVIAHRTITEEETKAERKLKESDLKNHLESKFGEKPKAGPESKTNDTSKKSEKRPNEGDLEKELLMSDNQILRALDILISYDIFKHLRNG